MMKKELLTCCLVFLTAPLFANALVDTLEVSQDDFQEESTTPKTKNGLHVLKLNVGGSFLTSKVEVGDYTYSFQPGWECLFEFEAISDVENGFGKGLGFILKANRTYIDGADRMRLYYFGMNRIWRKIPQNNKRWLWELAIGGGASLLEDKTRNSYYSTPLEKKQYLGFGILLKAGVEYRLTKHVGIGLEMNDIIHIFFDSALKAQREKAAITGFATTSLTLGLRAYLYDK